MHTDGYDAYRFDWMIGHRYGLGDFVRSFTRFVAEQGLSPNELQTALTTQPDRLLELWEADRGFDGECYVSHAEYLSSAESDDYSGSGTGSDNCSGLGGSCSECLWSCGDGSRPCLFSLPRQENCPFCTSRGDGPQD